MKSVLILNVLFATTIGTSFRLPLIAQLLYWSASYSVYCETILGNWEDCPTNFKTFIGCNETVKLSFALNTFINATCAPEVLKFDIQVASDDDMDTAVIIKTNYTANETHCTVFGTIDNVSNGYLSVIFVAKDRLNNSVNPESSNCTDHVLATDAIPSNLAWAVDCNKLSLVWSAPIPEYSIDEYLINITDEHNNPVYNTTTSEPFLIIGDLQSNAFVSNKRYKVSIKTLYCGGLTSIGSLDDEIITADIPKVSKNFTYSFTSIGPDRQTTIIDLKTNVIDINCSTSHPTSVMTLFTCTGSETLMDSKAREIDSETGNIVVSISEFPNGENCNGSIKWMNNFKNVTEPYTIFLSISHVDYFRAQFFSSDCDDLIIRPYSCYVSCCCIGDTKGSCLCDIKAQYTISNLTFIPNDSLICDGRYYLSCTRNDEIDISPNTSICTSRTSVLTTSASSALVTCSSSVNETQSDVNAKDDFNTPEIILLILSIGVFFIFLCFIMLFSILILILWRTKVLKSDISSHVTDEIQENQKTLTEMFKKQATVTNGDQKDQKNSTETSRAQADADKSEVINENGERKTSSEEIELQQHSKLTTNNLTPEGKPIELKQL